MSTNLDETTALHESKPEPQEQPVAYANEPEEDGSDDIESLIEPANPPGQETLLEELPPPIRAPTTPSPVSQPEAPGEEETPITNGGEVAITAGEDMALGGNTPTSPRLVMAIASGKGGVGKSLIAASVGVYLAQLGKRVVLVDANLGSGNLHTLLGVEEPRLSLHGLLNKEVKRIEEVVAQTPFRGLGLISSHDNAIGATNPRPAQKSRLLSQIRSLAVDYVIIDLAPGSDFNTLDLFLSADLHVMVMVPEPTAIESAFRLIKSAFIRKLRSLNGFDRLLADLQISAHCGIPTPNQIYEVGRERDPEMGEAIYQAMASFKPRLMVNMTRTRDDLEIGPALTTLGRRHLSLPFDYLGYVENEDMVWVTVRKRRPLLVEYPESKVAKDIERVTRRILSLENKERPECMSVPLPLERQSHYEILGLHPGAMDEEVRRAQRRLRRTYSIDSMAIYGVAPPGEVNKMHSRIEDAYATLADPEKRHLYDQRMFPGGTSLAVAIEEDTPTASSTPLSEHMLLEQHEVSGLGERPEMPALGEGTIFSGALLRKVREAKGMELQEIADRTKITLSYLRAIEEENYLSTPPPVYLRGFLKTVAKDLKLNSDQVVRTYMDRYYSGHKR